MPKQTTPEVKRGRGRPPGRATEPHTLSFTPEDWSWLQSQGKPAEVIRELIDFYRAAHAVLKGGEA